MPKPVSPAQVLPPNVLRSILKYRTPVKETMFDGMVREKDDIKEVLYVCSNWRQAVLECMWRELSLIIGYTDRAVFIANPRWAKHFRLPLRAADMVREVRISVPWATVISGKAKRLLSEYMGETTKLPLAHMLFLSILNQSEIPQLNEADSIQNALEFVQLLRSLIRETLTKAEIMWHGGSSFRSELAESVIKAVVNSLCSNSKRSAATFSKVMFEHAASVDFDVEFSSLELGCDTRVDLRTSLLHKNANSLQNLKIAIRESEALILDINGKAVNYPNLQYLSLDRCRDQREEEALDPSIVPFPALKSLKIYMRYPFAGDELFRGNSSTLKYLDLWEIGDTLIVLHRSNALDKHRDMEVTINGANYANFGLPDETMSTILVYLARSARSLTLPESLVVKDLKVAVQDGYEFEYTQVIEAASAKLSLYFIICLLKAFPALTKLKCGISGLGSELEGIAANQLPDYIASTYGAMGKNMRDWHVSSTNDDDDPNIIDCIVLFALVCPNIQRINVAQCGLRNYNARVSWVRRRGSFRKYSSQLSRAFSQTHSAAPSARKFLQMASKLIWW